MTDIVKVVKDRMQRVVSRHPDGEQVVVDTGHAAVRDRYRAQREEATRRRRRLFRSLGMDSIEAVLRKPL